MLKRTFTNCSSSRRHAAPVLLLLVSCLASCNASTGSQAPEPATPQAAATGSGAARTAACPSQDFRTFLTSFMNEPGVQEAFTRRPLQWDSMDVAAEPEPRRVSRMVDGANLRFPVMPSPQRQAQDGLEMRLKLNGNDKVEVVLFKPDTDDVTSYFFVRNGCWRLYWIQSDSL